MHGNRVGPSATIDSVSQIVRRAHSVAIQTSSFEASYDFYTRILGLPVIREPFKFKKRTLAWIDAGGLLIELFSVKDDVSPQKYDDRAVGVTHLAFEVSDLDALVDYLAKHRVKITKGPLLPASGDPKQPRVLFVHDPDGAAIQFREPECA